jgi:hypothetical protein
VTACLINLWLEARLCHGFFAEDLPDLVAHRGVVSHYVKLVNPEQAVRGPSLLTDDGSTETLLDPLHKVM